MKSESLRLHLRVLKKNIVRLYNRQKKIQTSHELVEIKSPHCDTFFGYYDISPFDDKGSVLYSVLPKNSDKIKVAINSVDGKSERVITESFAWNWQQGCRLRWMPKTSNHISFNDFRDGKYCNRIINLEDNSERVIQYPLYDIDNNCIFGLSLDYERLGRMRPGYGYTCSKKEKNLLNNQGVEIIDIHHNNLIKIIDYQRIASLFNRQVHLENCYLNHLSFSPSGEQFLFFFIEIINNYHLASLLVYIMKDDNIILLDENEKVSHYVWENDDTIICTAYKDPWHCFYCRYSIHDKSKTIVVPNILNEDGHPSIFNDKQILSDTYPDIQYFQSLFICDEVKKSKKELIKIYSNPYITGEQRTDLHPRLSSNKELVAFDANVRGNRSFYILNLNN